jgi:hypothetical protein
MPDMPIAQALGNRLFRASLRATSAVWPRMPLVRDAAGSALICDETETLLNLPESHAIFPTQPTPIADVQRLLAQLHPVSCRTPLIRMGRDFDGGYLVPDDLDGIEACFSPGVSTESGFELDCAHRGMRVFMADASVERPPIKHQAFTFLKKFIGSTTEGDTIAFDEWVESAQTTGDLLLQMDIEGHEYETLISAPTSLLQRFRIVVAEFHFLDHLFSAPLFPLYSAAFRKLLRTHTCVHIHPNNMSPLITVRDVTIPQMAEYTFLRTDRVVEPTYTREFPHPLDRDNDYRRHLRLPESCFASSSVR